MESILVEKINDGTIMDVTNANGERFSIRNTDDIRVSGGVVHIYENISPNKDRAYEVAFLAESIESVRYRTTVK